MSGRKIQKPLGAANLILLEGTFSELKSASPRCAESFQPIKWPKDLLRDEWFKFTKLRPLVPKAACHKKAWSGPFQPIITKNNNFSSIQDVSEESTLRV